MQTNSQLTATDIADSTAKISVMSILVTGFIYCIALLI